MNNTLEEEFSMVIDVKNHQMEDEYKITIEGEMVIVENISVPDKCAININNFEDNEDGTIREAFNDKDWNLFICELIEVGYLD